MYWVGMALANVPMQGVCSNSENSLLSPQRPVPQTHDLTRSHWVRMNSEDFSRQLGEIANAGDDFEYQSIQLTERWKGDENASEAVEPILRFMESHPDVDYGTPGALVHFVETFSSYERKLVQSVEHRPTPQTVGMLNRVINGERDPKKRQALLATLERVLEHPQADSMTRSRAFDYLEFQLRTTADFSELPQ
jgi:hypothetical protein